MAAPLFPLFVDLSGRTVVVVGGGSVARRKVAALLDAGARVTVGAPALEPELAELARRGAIQHLVGAFDPNWLNGAWLAIAATDLPAVNRAVAVAGEARRVWVNVVDDAPLSSVQVPSRVERGPLQIAISSGGGAPMLARHLREQLETQFDESLGALATLLTRDPMLIGMVTMAPILPWLFFALPAGVLMYMVIANIFQTLQTFILSREPLPLPLKTGLAVARDIKEDGSSDPAKTYEGSGDAFNDSMAEVNDMCLARLYPDFEALLAAGV